MFGGQVRAAAASLAIAAALIHAGCLGLGDGSGSAPITGPPPTADMVAERTLVKAGIPVALSLDVVGLAPVTYAWDFGDGDVLEGEGLAGVSHTFAAAGAYVVTATATDASLNFVTASITIDVTPSGGAPVLTVESVELRGTIVDATECTVTVNGSSPVPIDAGAFTWNDTRDTSPEIYNVRAVDQGGNVTTRTVTVTVN